MGSTTSKEDKMVDDGYSNTNGLYSNVVQDYDKKVVRKLITSRKLAPFYKGLDQIDTPSEKTPVNEPSSSAPTTKQNTNNKSLLYANAVECPICFWYYPSNINFSKCCDQPLCTECFVQMKRTDPHLPACCPFCVQPNFGIIYHLPSSVTNAQRYSAIFSPTPSCHHVFMKNVISRSVPCHETSPPPNANAKTLSSSPLTLQQTNSHTRRSLAKQKPSMIVLIDHIRPGFDDQAFPITSTAMANMDSSLPLRRYYATDTTMQSPSFDDWMFMEAIRRSVQDQQNQQNQQQQHMSDSSSLLPNTNNSEALARSSLDQRTPGTTMAPNDSSIPG
ncbi:hypothetical protein BCR42DRAFT_419117 [Absidia repens]|uniref:RING-type domain-containing protein n=1 Tax=Absidia repens TaxID=90262 RepID=A0A1X2IAW0_9FUNG|nr:hypothetical protein BCR42DRAFT_419117 [Absidia repens]